MTALNKSEEELLHLAAISFCTIGQSKSRKACCGDGTELSDCLFSNLIFYLSSAYILTM